MLPLPPGFTTSSPFVVRRMTDSQRPRSEPRVGPRVEDHDTSSILYGTPIVESPEPGVAPDLHTEEKGVTVVERQVVRGRRVGWGSGRGRLSLRLTRLP